MSMIVDRIKSLDAVGEEFGFDIKGHGRHVTWYSLFCSFFLYLISGLVLYKLTSDYFKTDDPNITSTFQFSKTYPKMDLYANQIGFAFALDDYGADENNITPEDITKYITPYIRVITHIKVPEGSTADDEQRTYYGFKPCKDLIADTVKTVDKVSQVYKASEFKDFFIEKFLCIDFAGQTT